MNAIEFPTDQFRRKRRGKINHPTYRPRKFSQYLTTTYAIISVMQIGTQLVFTVSNGS